MVRGDSLNYAHAAFGLSQGSLDIGAWVGNTRVGLYFPVALLYSVFGPSELTTFAFPFLLSLSNVVFVFLIARIFSNQAGGLIAALIWAFFPLDVFLSTSLLPDSTLASLSTAGMYFLLLAVKEKRRKRLNTSIAFALIIFAILVKPIAFMSLFAALGIVLVDRREAILAFGKRYSLRLGPAGVKKIKWALFIVIIPLLAIYANIQPYPLIVTLANSAFDLSGFLISGSAELDVSGHILVYSSLLVFISPLILMAFVWAIIKQPKELSLLLLWSAFVFFYYEWGTIHLQPLFYVPITPYNEARNFLFVLAPLVIMLSIFINNLISGKFKVSYLALIALLALWAAFIYRNDVLLGLTPQWILGLRLLLPVLSIAIVAISKAKNEIAKSSFVFFLLFSIVISSIAPSIPFHALWYTERAERLDQMYEALAYIDNFPNSEILVESNAIAMTLNYVSRFTLGFNWRDIESADHPARISTPASEKKTETINLIVSSSLPEIDGWEVEKIIVGEKGPNLYILTGQ